MAVVARVWVAGELVNAAKMNSISTDLTELSGRVGTEIAAVSQTVTNAIAALGSASTHDVGTGSGTVPVLDSGGHLENARLSGIPNTALSSSTGMMTGVSFNTNVTLGEYVLSRNVVITDAGQSSEIESYKWSVSVDGTMPTDAKDRFHIGGIGGSTRTINVYWRRLAASDRPAVWVRLVNGQVATISVSEDPPADEDNTTAPFGLQEAGEDDQGIVIPALTGQRIVNIGLPSDAILSTLMASRSSALSSWQAYLVTRGWVNNPPATYAATIALVSARYQPSARLWAMRTIATEDGISETDAYLTLLQVGSNDAWELP